MQVVHVKYLNHYISVIDRLFSDLENSHSVLVAKISIVAA